MKKNDISWPGGWDIAVALVLLTRLPLPRLPHHAFDRQAKAAWAYPLAGLLVGGLAALVALGALTADLPAPAAAGMALAAAILCTGAMHEDGLADTADGFWGGTTPARRLEIMKDSRIGTYGVLALILSVLLRWVALSALLEGGMLWALPVAATWSRALMPALMTALPHARPDGLSGSVGRPPMPVTGAGLVIGLALCLVLGGFAPLLPVICAVLAVAALAALAKAKIGGQTGDVLGAAQQLAEITVLLGLAAGI